MCIDRSGHRLDSGTGTTGAVLVYVCVIDTGVAIVMASRGSVGGCRWHDSKPAFSAT